MRPEFRVHLLNELGINRAQELAVIFSESLERIELVTGTGSREAELVRTHLEIASYYAKRAMAQRPVYQRSSG